jgi:hypothetical protein
VDELIKLDVRKDRVPKDSSHELTKVMNNYFVQATGIPFRSESIFVTANYYASLVYGDPYMVFPIGNIKTAFSEKISDAWVTFEEGLNLEDATVPSSISEFDARIVTDSLNAIGVHTTQARRILSLEKALRNNHQIYYKFIAELLSRGNFFKFNEIDNDVIADQEIMVACDSYYAYKLDKSLGNNNPEISKLLKELHL